jgi:hypothetical protein
MNRKQHWNRLYTQKGERDVSWFEALPEISLRMLGDAGLTSESCVIDVGGGDSRLVDALTAKGLDCVAVLDVSRAALNRAKQADSLARELGQDFQLAESVGYVHHTPWSASQAFRYSRFTRTS